MYKDAKVIVTTYRRHIGLAVQSDKFVTANKQPDKTFAIFKVICTLIVANDSWLPTRVEACCLKTMQDTSNWH